MRASIQPSNNGRPTEGLYIQPHTPFRVVQASKALLDFITGHVLGPPKPDTRTIFFQDLFVTCVGSVQG